MRRGGYSAAVTRFPLLLAFAAGLVSALGFAPLDWWPLTLVALAGLMHLVRTATTRKSALLTGYVFGLGHFIVGLNWIAGAFQYQDAMPKWLGWIAVVLLSLYLAIYPMLAAGLSWRFGRQRADVFVLLFAAFWIITEWLRGYMFTGFAWGPLGVVLVPTYLDHFAAQIGTYGLSGIVVILAGLLLAFAYHVAAHGLSWPKSGTWVGLGFGTIFILPWVLAMLGAINLDEEESSAGPLLRIVQPNIGQQDKHVKAFDKFNFEKLAGLTGKPGLAPRLILWPEAAVPDFLEEEEWARNRLAKLLGPRDMLVTGGIALVEDKDGFVIAARNSSFVLTPGAKLIGRYDKAHLVPYGEYLPMRPVLSAIGLSRLVPGDLDFWPGPGPQSFAVPGFGTMGVQICYEIIFPGHVIDAKNRPDFLFNPSNDAWFGAWGPPQHLAQARLRAIEEGMPVVRSTPTGISAIIDADGRVLHKLPYRKGGYIQARLPSAHAPTPFARHGNILSFVFAFFLGALAIALPRFRR